MRVEVVRDASGLTPQVQDAWHALAAGSGLPYATPGWMLAFLEHWHRPEGGELLAVLVRDGDALIGVGPFVGPARGGSRLVPARYGYLGVGIGQRSGPLATPGREAEVARAVAGELARAEPAPAAVLLDAVDASAAWPRLLADAWPGARRPWIRTADVEPAPSVGVHPDGYDAWLAGRSRNFREQVRRRTKAAARRGATVRLATTPEQVERDLEALWSLHRARFAQQSRATSLDARLLRCVTAACLALLPTGALRLWVAETAAGEVVGAQLYLHAGARVCFYNGGTSPDWERESLGLVLMARAVADAHELPEARALDLGAGAGAYKLRFADADEPVAWRRVVVPAPRGVLADVHAAPGDLRRAARQAALRLPEERQAQLRTAVRRVRR